jgi:predicted GNAT family N-acyltransferase
MTGVEELLMNEGRIKRIFLNARGTAIGFYAKLGYTGVGEEFTEVGIPHLRMDKAIL